MLDAAALLEFADRPEIKAVSHHDCLVKISLDSETTTAQRLDLMAEVLNALCPIRTLLEGETLYLEFLDADRSL